MQGESMVASKVSGGYPIRAYKDKRLGAVSGMVPVCKAPGPHSSLEEFLHPIILKSKCRDSCQAQ